MSAIPKIVHYVWVGPNPITPLAVRCIASWKKYLPDYKIKLWNETNSPMDHHYVKAMYEKGKWAFVSDYIRFWVLANEGGIYLDTDMEVLKPLDDFLGQVGFVGRSKSGHIESSIIGAIPQADFVQKALSVYDKDHVYNLVTSPVVLQNVINELNDISIKIYDYSYFFPCDEGEKVDSSSLANAYTNHHWAESWVPHARVRKLARRLRIMPFLKKIFR